MTVRCLIGVPLLIRSCFWACLREGNQSDVLLRVGFTFFSYFQATKRIASLDETILLLIWNRRKVRPYLITTGNQVIGMSVFTTQTSFTMKCGIRWVVVLLWKKSAALIICDTTGARLAECGKISKPALPRTDWMSRSGLILLSFPRKVIATAIAWYISLDRKLSSAWGGITSKDCIRHEEAERTLILISQRRLAVGPW